jgi:hypothetical protein
MGDKIEFKSGSVIETIDTESTTVRSKIRPVEFLLEDLMKSLTPWQRFQLRIQFKIDDIKYWFEKIKFKKYIE